MIVLPAIDLAGGRCVRLAQGRFDAATVYPGDPLPALERFAEAGARWAHVVDLDGARAGAPAQRPLIERLARASPLNLQVAGGLRSRDDAARLLDAGAARVVIGSMAVRDPDGARALLAEAGSDRVALALDVNLVRGRPMVALDGWTTRSQESLFDVAAAFPEARHLLVTDIARDGMMRGPNLGLIGTIVRLLPRVALQASGGVASLRDLARIAAAGAAAAIVGRAIWEGRFDLREALSDAGA